MCDMNTTKRVAYITLGCKLNFAETSALATSLRQAGFVRVASSESADVYVINTCAVTGASERKCRQTIHKIVRREPHACVVVTGCFAQLKASEIAEIPGVSMVLGSNEKFDLTALLSSLEGRQQLVRVSDIAVVDHFRPAFSTGGRTRSFLKVQDGCNYHCAYCTVPLARGKSRNAPVAEVVQQAREIVALGYREIVLTGVNIGDFGRSTGESFYELLCALEQVEGLNRLRISSVEPNLLSDKIITLVAESQVFMPHFHIPLQSGCNKVLRLMQRRYPREVFLQRIELINNKIPHAFIGVDVIVGHPGETAADFDETLHFLERCEVSFLHVFSYSARSGTPSALHPDKVAATEIKRRSEVLHSLSAKKHRAFYERFAGRRCEVLFESTRSNGNMVGYTDNYIKVEHPYTSGLVNRIVDVVLERLTPHTTYTISLPDNPLG